jgi:cobalt/nickel transport system permease protein
MGVMSAFIFSAQMFNFPVIAGTSGHLLGGVLAAVLLGPNPAVICLSCVLIVQCLIFQDGGVTALGANILNMSIVGTLGGYSAYRSIRKFTRGQKGIIIGAAVAGWLSVVLSSAACAIELAVSGTAPFKITLFSMVGVHALIGAVEAIITGLIVGFVLKVRPDLVYSG